MRGKIGLLITLFIISGCGGGSTSTSPATQTSTVVVSGNISFDLVPTDKVSGLVYASTIQKPARGITIEAINASNSSILATTSTDNLGHYSVTVPIRTSIKIRIKAQITKTGTTSWDFRVVDNTNSQSLYAADSVSFNSGASNATKSYNLPSGWGGSSYTATRTAAPFAILDTVYKAMLKVTAADSTVSFPQLLINWSVNNIGTPGDIKLGQIETSHYDPTSNQLYILGKADNDTDEYDDHVIAHEWGHYFEFNFSRSDSPGGSHSPGDKLDPRISFGEGFGNAFSGMVTDDPNYIDTGGASQVTVNLALNLSDSNGDPSSIGWYSEDSVQYILYSLYNNLGFKPIYIVFATQQKTTNSFTTIYSFIAYLKTNNPLSATTINNLLAAKNISSSFINIWDSTATETNDGGDSKSLPVYKVVTVGSPAVQVCGNDQFGFYNKLMNRRFVVFQIASTAAHTLTITPATAGGVPNYRLFSAGQELVSEVSNSASAILTLSGTFTAGIYYAEIYDQRHVTGSAGVIGEFCFNVTLN